jgi:hypothetical protein
VLAAAHRVQQRGAHGGQGAAVREPLQQGQQAGELGVLDAVVRHQQGQALAGVGATGAPDAGALALAQGGHLELDLPDVAGGHLGGGRPRGGAVFGELDHRLVPERPGAAQRVGGVADQLAAPVVVDELDQVLHAVDRRPREAQLPGVTVAARLQAPAAPRHGDLLEQPGGGQVGRGVVQAEGDAVGADQRPGVGVGALHACTIPVPAPDAPG